MPGRLQNVAAFVAAASVFVLPSFAAASEGIAALVDRLDPSARRGPVEIGFNRRLPFGIETTVSLFRAESDGVSPTTRTRSSTEAAPALGLLWS